jgi:hypothetical protein
MHSVPIYVLWWLGELLLLLQISLAIRGRFLSKYPVFYAYVCYLLLQGLFGLYVYTFRSHEYKAFYWAMQFLSVAGGYCLMWEAYDQVFKGYVGTAKMARLLVNGVFLSVAGKFLIGLPARHLMTFPVHIIIFERDLRAVQGALLVILVALIAYYRIPLGRNLRGLIMGYGFAIATGMILLTLRSYIGQNFLFWWQHLQQTCTVVTLLIWCVTLRSYHPNPKPEAEIEIERDYEVLSAQTAMAVAKARGYLLRTVRS